ncbi:DUF4974 domain-containing protein [Pedobacter polaris]|uniref:DUF4974 domain-containing protein n=2 Tax=Pedobacter polaris TaxID=2571273 RepID=A0A4U1CKV0_9SPHI|nr:DUF4974 domain-containing protein [Pedobacter polaris]
MDRPSENTLIRYFRGQCLPHEIELIELYLSMDIDHVHVADSIKTAWLNGQKNSHLHISDADVEDFSKRFYALQAKLNQLPPLKDQQPVSRSVLRFPVWMKVAAAVLILAGTTLLLYHYHYQTKGSELAQNVEDVLPGGNKAMLTLADGSVVSLSDEPNGKLALQDGLEVAKTKEGEITYSSAKKNSGSSYAINTIATPRGGQYRVILPDGTKAWLNAASTLSYPLRFQKEGRKVKMTGEVYFEVAKAINSGTGRRIPFLVETSKQRVQVLGTHFNVKAYPDEPDVRTTLLEGSVKIVSGNGQAALLHPGQLAVLTGHIEVASADIDRELAWKNGDFIFRGETLESALRQVARWYNVEVECPEKLGRLRFNGMISRKQPLSTIVDMIQLTKLAKVTIKGRRLIVTD